MKYLKQISIGLIAIILVMGLSVYKIPTASASCGNSYSYCQTVTIDHTQAGSGNSTNFPLEASTTQTSLKTVGNGGRVQNTTTQTGSSYTGTIPADLIFTSDSGCNTKLNWEFESYSATAGSLIAWVNIPTLSASVDTVIYMCYGNSSISTFQGNVNGTWNTNYVLVTHLPDGTTLNTNDSTSNVLNLTNTGSVATGTGQIDGDISFTGGANYLTNSGNAAFNSTDYSLEAWAKFTDGNSAALVSHGPNNNVAGHYYFYKTNSGLGNQLSLDIPFVLGNLITGATTLSNNVFYHCAITKSGNNYVIYLNGVSDATKTDATAPSATGPFYEGAYIFNSGGTVLTIDGNIDEVKISNIARPADWFLSEYNNQKSGSTMVTFGAEQTGSSVIAKASTLISATGAFFIKANGSYFIKN